MKKTPYILLLALGLLLEWTGCVPTPHDVVMSEEKAVIYPDYQDVTVPYNIAPLNFMLRGDYDACLCEIKDEKGHTLLTLGDKGRKLIFDEYLWRMLTRTSVGKQVHVTLTARRKSDNQWIQYPDFSWTISPDSIDAFITYRLIEPGYEVWDNVCIEERCTENFAHRLLADGRQLGNRCMNCHTHGGEQGHCDDPEGWHD